MGPVQVHKEESVRVEVFEQMKLWGKRRPGLSGDIRPIMYTVATFSTRVKPPHSSSLGCVVKT